MKWLRDHALTLALFAIFALSFGGQAASGLADSNHDRLRDGLAPLGLMAYLGGGAFLSSVFENWESEFLQMWVYVMFTAYLFQRGSPESNDPDKPLPETRPTAKSPWAARQGGWIRKLYGHSLGIALGLLFLVSFVLHWLNSARDAAEEAMRRGEIPETALAYLGDARFWFESFQNWQSEFLSTAILILLSIILREDRSPESKGVDEPHAKSG